MKNLSNQPPALRFRWLVTFFVVVSSIVHGPLWAESQVGNAVGSCKTNWMKQGGVGLATAYFPFRSDRRESVADAFQVDTVAKQAADAGAAWFLLSLHHESWILMAPSTVYDRLMGNSEYTTTRDVPLELSRELEHRGIKLMLYVNLRIDPTSSASPKVRDALGGWPPNDQMIKNIADVYRELSLRYGKRVAGWWVDGVQMKEYKNAPQRELWFSTISGALRAGNSSALVAFNPGVVIRRYSASDDFTAGEMEELGSIPTGRWLDGAQWHMWTFLGNWWPSGGTRFADRELEEFVSAVTVNGGALTFSVATSGIMLDCKDKKCRNAKMNRTPYQGYIDPGQLEQLKRVRESVHLSTQPRPETACLP